MTQGRRASLRRFAASAVAVLVAVTTIQAMSVATNSSAEAAGRPPFDPGNIIDDSLFWDGAAMNEAQIQTFLNQKVPSCSPGYTCLKDYRQSTYTIAATPMCGEYVGAANEPAARIIAKVAATCGVSPKVLLVMLQKEQGLVTSTQPSDGRYRAAMGAACPDTAACDATYYGFFNQVHYAAYLLKRYTMPAGTGPGTPYTIRYDQRYPVGQTTSVLYHPSGATCGTQAVTIQNQATHALYIYTPYAPNAAALAAGYGTGDGCSSYGNRNFYNYYVDWFGSVRGPSVGAAFLEKYQASGGGMGALGYPTGAYTCGLVNGGCYQVFSGGWIVSSATTAPTVVSLSNRWVWGGRGNENGYLGYPTADEVCGLRNGGCYQLFQGGWIVHSDDTPTVSVSLATRGMWWYYGNENGWLGYPLAEEVCGLPSSGCYQQFQGGWVTQSSVGGMRAMWPEVWNLWSNWGRQAGILGYATGDPTNVNGGTYTQTFQGGTVTVTAGVAALTSATDPWFNARIQSPWLGAQTAGQTCGLPSSGCYQPFTGGWVVSSSSGAFAMRSEVATLWANWGRWAGIMGYPTSAPSDPNGGSYTQTFQGGTVTVTAGVAALTSATDPWFNARIQSPWLGAQTAGQTCGLPSSGCYQPFTGGWVVSSSSGAFAMRSEVATLWANWGRWAGIMGYPTSAPSDPNGGSYTQTFQGGTVTVTAGVATLTSATDPWFNARLTSPWLGAQTAGQTCGLPGGGCYQPFTGGWIVSSPAGAFAVRSEVATLWANWGRWAGIMRYPTSAPSDPNGGSYTQTFQGGTVTVTAGTAALTSATDPWFNARLTSPWLGGQTAGQTCGLPGGGCYQPFTGGWIVSSPSGAFAVRSEVAALWSDWGKWAGIMGYPTSAPSDPNGGSYTQTFQGGTVTVTAGAAALTSATDPWFNARLTSPWLGGQTAGQTCGLPGGGCYQPFTGGWIVSSPSGAFAVRNEVVSLWTSLGKWTGALGYPTGAPSQPNGGSYTQTFQGGTVTVNGGVAAVSGT